MHNKSSDTCHISLTPTARATDPSLANCPTMHSSVSDLDLDPSTMSGKDQYKKTFFFRAAIVDPF